MNYTKPQNPDQDDTPQDWLNSALIFTRALSLLLDEQEGVVVDIVGDVKFKPEEKIERAIVYYSKNQVHIVECDKDLEPGTMIIMHEINEN